MERKVILEPAAVAVCDAAAVKPRIYQLPPKEGREALERIQDSPVYKYPAKIDRTVYHTQSWSSLPVYIVRTVEGTESGNVILYIHGAGWVFGSFHTHEKLVRELAARTGCTVVFPEYALAPEAHYPVALEQCYSVLSGLRDILASMGCNMNEKTLTVAGDSAGGNLAIAMTLLAKYRKGPEIHKQLLYYPVTNACFNTASYCLFAKDYYLYRDGMMWFWNQYTESDSDRDWITASPLRAEKEQLLGLPEAMILNGQADVLRDEGEAYAEKLRRAGIPVTALRFQAIIHDFVMLNSLDQTRACRAAMDVSTQWIKRKNMEVSTGKEVYSSGILSSRTCQ